MVAYSFKKDFGPPIVSGQKTGTIRGPRKRHALMGEHLQLFTGMRTKYCKKIIPDPLCKLVMPISLDVRPKSMGPITVGSSRWLLHPYGADLFAQRDGFASMEAMHAFWLSEHGEGMFEGFWICWKDWREAGLTRYFQ